MTTTTVPDIDTLRIGVLCGGNSPERPGSIASGEHAAKALAGAGLNTELIDVADTPVAALAGRVDVALLGLHGLGGEDGKVQGALETAGIPYTGSGVLASALGMHKPTCKKLLVQARIDTPAWVVIDPTISVESTLSVVRHSIGHPVFVKPSSGGGSLAAGIAHDDVQLRALIEETKSDAYAEYMVEEYVQGIPCTVGLVEVDGRLTVLPVHDVESRNAFYDYEAKHDPDLRVEHCPSILPETATSSMQYLARRVFDLLGAHGVLRVDFMAGANGRNTVLEANTLPGLSQRGNLATMARAGGIPYPVLMQHVLRTAFTKPGYLP
ncbi:D-alanine--D-alanine ligase [Streptomyces sp. NPDC015408]|uniref:D-alanine--D-alanine ligase family protein n=1 Tax=Streptomyces sp. NPDC015408 TaxID=3364956 RepID=UPI0036F5F4BD